jgi:prefoldin subunit 5
VGRRSARVGAAHGRESQIRPGEMAMPKNWEEMTANEKLNQLRSEVDSLGRVTEGVRRRIEQIRSDLETIENALSRREGGA